MTSLICVDGKKMHLISMKIFDFLSVEKLCEDALEINENLEFLDLGQEIQDFH